jgi:hypothetical protein
LKLTIKLDPDAQVNAGLIASPSVVAALGKNLTLFMLHVYAALAEKERSIGTHDASFRSQ